MQVIRSRGTIALALATLLCSAAAADTAPQQDAAGFGPADTLGAANHLSDAGALTASRLVTEGKRSALGLVSSRGNAGLGRRNS